jgi:peptidoglycan/LPS O-acetylase OafA/YrhL
LWQAPPFKQIAGTWTNFGWTGVDLFFVLSGFLVSGLLFREYQQHGRVRIVRFLIRRGFKIYPGFFVVLLVGVALKYGQWAQLKSMILCDALFLQNYTVYIYGALWPHFWSLAVEEHFYIGLSVVILAFALRRCRDPFLGLVGLYFLTALACLYWRASAAAPDYFNNPAPGYYFPIATHQRLDALLFGVVLSYLYHFRPELLEPIHQRKVLVTAVSAAMLAPACFLNSYSFFVVTLGITMTYLGYGGLLLVCLGRSAEQERSAGRVGPFLAWIGSYSYSIYLWHWLFVSPLDFTAWMTRHCGPYLAAAAFFATCTAVGIVMGKLIEMPFLRLRDRLFPSHSQPRSAIAAAVLIRKAA